MSAEWVDPNPLNIRDPQCVARWPECESGAHHPDCCRFPKSCSCLSYTPTPEETAASLPTRWLDEEGNEIRPMRFERFDPDEMEGIRQVLDMVDATDEAGLAGYGVSARVVAWVRGEPKEANP